jgi:hypothetical protein
MRLFEVLFLRSVFKFAATAELVDPFPVDFFSTGNIVTGFVVR